MEGPEGQDGPPRRVRFRPGVPRDHPPPRRTRPDRRGDGRQVLPNAPPPRLLASLRVRGRRRRDSPPRGSVPRRPPHERILRLCPIDGPPPRPRPVRRSDGPRQAPGSDEAGGDGVVRWGGADASHARRRAVGLVGGVEGSRRGVRRDGRETARGARCNKGLARTDATAFGVRVLWALRKRAVPGRAVSWSNSGERSDREDSPGQRGPRTWGIAGAVRKVPSGRA
mmetsp:Transcript_47482/g.143718  ORF Transcript_47482/g.143718 Transcript_47482/m.143718 type:complete len:225 (+) Transcript_47482:198-872(+)